MDDLFLLVLAGHLLGDFVTQTDWQAANKEASWRADLSHVLANHVTMAVLVLPMWKRLALGMVPRNFSCYERIRRSEMAHQALARFDRQQELCNGFSGE